MSGAPLLPHDQAAQGREAILRGADRLAAAHARNIVVVARLERQTLLSGRKLRAVRPVQREFTSVVPRQRRPRLDVPGRILGIFDLLRRAVNGDRRQQIAPRSVVVVIRPRAGASAASRVLHGAEHVPRRVKGVGIFQPGCVIGRADELAQRIILIFKVLAVWAAALAQLGDAIHCIILVSITQLNAPVKYISTMNHSSGIGIRKSRDGTMPSLLICSFWGIRCVGILA